MCEERRDGERGHLHILSNGVTIPGLLKHEEEEEGTQAIHSTEAEAPSLRLLVFQVRSKELCSKDRGRLLANLLLPNNTLYLAYSSLQ